MNKSMHTGLGIALGVALGASFRHTQHDCPECAVIHQKHETGTRQLGS